MSVHKNKIGSPTALHCLIMGMTMTAWNKERFEHRSNKCPAAAILTPTPAWAEESEADGHTLSRSLVSWT